jgi:hypothetical protein
MELIHSTRAVARNLETQRTEALVQCVVLNHMRQLGMPETIHMG